MFESSISLIACCCLNRSFFAFHRTITGDDDGRQFNCSVYQDEFYDLANDTMPVFNSSLEFGGILPGTPGVGFEVIADTLKGFINATLTAQIYFEDSNATLDAAFQWRGINSTAHVILH